MIFREREREYRTLHTIVFDDLLHDGYDWGKDDWTIPNYLNADYATTIRLRVNHLIEDTYRWREVGNTIKFRDFMIKNLNIACSKYGRAYLLYNSKIEDRGTSESKSRVVNSDYPQAQLKGSNDYASSGTDMGAKDWGKLGDIEKLSAYKDLFDTYDDIDTLLVEAVDKCFRHYV